MVLKRRVDCPAKIAEFQHSKAIENILRLDISVHDRMTVEALQGCYDLPKVVSSLILAEAVLIYCTAYLAFQLSEETTAAGELQQQINILSVTEATVHLQSVWVI